MHSTKRRYWHKLIRVTGLLMLSAVVLSTGCTIRKKEAAVMVALRADEPQNDFFINSAILAIEEWNSDTSHKIKGALVRYDYSGDSMKMGEEYSSVIFKDKPIAVISASQVSTDVVKMMPKIHSAGVPFMTRASEGRLTAQRLENLFRIQVSDAAACNLAVRYIAEDLKIKKIAMIYPQEDFGRDIRTDLERAASVYNVQLIKLEPYLPSNPVSVEMAIKAVNSSDAQMCLLWPEAGGSSELMMGLQKTALKMPFFGNTEFSYIGGDQGELKKYEGSYVMSPFMYLSSHEYWRDRMQARFGFRPTQNESPVIYDAVNQVLTTLEESEQKISPATLIADLHEQSYTGLVGTYSYDEKGEGMRQVYIGKIQKGKVRFVKIENFGH